MPMYQWSTTPGNNATAGSINWAEGQAPSTVNDSARQMMADVATWFQAPEWLNYGLTPTYISATSFSVAGNQTAIYSVGRRVRASVTAGIVYGTIQTSAFASVTTVTVTWDTGSLDSGLSEADVHLINPALHQNFALQTLTLNEPGNGTSTLTVNAPNDSNGANIKLVGNGSTTPNKYIASVSGVFQIANSARNQGLLNLTDSGDLSVVGNITANSDESLKKDWESLPADFVDRLAALRSGTYTRIDSGERHVGVGAQSLQGLLPEAVTEGVNEMLSVAYGQAALAACVELAKEVMRLRALLEPVK